MRIDAIPQGQQLPSLRSSDVQSKSADKTDTGWSLENQSVKVDISDDARLALEREMQNIAKARHSQEFVDFRGKDGNIRLGIWALGRTAMDDWSAKGLEVTEKSVLAAAEAFQEAFSKKLDGNDFSSAGSGIALNRHQIIIDSQPVPDWFLEEYESALSSMGGSEVKDAFENGDTFFARRR